MGKKNEVMLASSAVLAAVIVLLAAEGDYAEETVTLEEVVQQAYADSGLSPEAWNALPDEEREAKFDTVIRTMTEERTAIRQADKDATQRAVAEEEHHVVMEANGALSCNVYGVEYKTAKDGTVKVPASAVEHLLPHGFTVKR